MVNPPLFSIKYTVHLWYHYINGVYVWHLVHHHKYINQFKLPILSEFLYVLVLSVDVWLVSGLWIGLFSKTKVICVMPLEKPLLDYAVSLHCVEVQRN